MEFRELSHCKLELEEMHVMSVFTQQSAYKVYEAEQELLWFPIVISHPARLWGCFLSSPVGVSCRRL